MVHLPSLFIAHCLTKLGVPRGSQFHYRNGTSGMEPGQDLGMEVSCEQVAQTLTSPATAGQVPPHPAGLSGPV